MEHHFPGTGIGSFHGGFVNLGTAGLQQIDVRPMVIEREAGRRDVEDRLARQFGPPSSHKAFEGRIDAHVATTGVLEEEGRWNRLDQLFQEVEVLPQPQVQGLPLAFVFAEFENVLGVAQPVAQCKFAEANPAISLAGKGDLLQRQFDHRRLVQHPVVAGGQTAGKRRLIQFLIGAADDEIAGPAEQLLAAAIDPGNPQVVGTFDDGHAGQILEDGVEHLMRPLEQSFRKYPLGDLVFQARLRNVGAGSRIAPLS